MPADHENHRLPRARLEDVRRAVADRDFVAAGSLESEIFDSLLADMGRGNSYAADDVRTLSPARQAWVICSWSELELNNGGFDQYFLNSSGDLAWEAAAAFRYFDAETIASLFDEACSRWPRDVGQDIIARRDWLIDRSDETDTPFCDDLDTVFFSNECDGGTSILYRLSYVTRDPTEFIEV